jgi:alpha-tubulin suppressor-like RCC1 family protein
VLCNDKSVRCWGDNEHGQCNIPTFASPPKQIVAGAFHTVALLESGAVVCWGLDNTGQCRPPKIVGATTIAAGEFHSVALTSDNKLYSWGNNDFGQLKAPKVLDEIVTIAAGGYLSAAVTVDGEIRFWGENEAAVSAYFKNTRLKVPTRKSLRTVVEEPTAIPKIDDPPTKPESKPNAITPAEERNQERIALIPVVAQRIVQLQAITVAAASLTNNPPAVGPNEPANRDVETPPNSAPQVSLKDRLKSTVDKILEQAKLKPKPTIEPAAPVPVVVAPVVVEPVIAPPPIVRSKAPDAFHASYLRVHKCVAAFNDALVGVTPNGSIVGINGQVKLPEGFQNAKALSSRGLHLVGITSQNGVVVTGNNAFQQSVPPANLRMVVDIATGRWFSLALTNSGRVLSWGSNQYGERDISLDKKEIVAIAAGDYHSVALYADMTLAAYGYNNRGQLNIPKNDEYYVAVACGTMHSVAITDTGDIVAWGDNRQHQCEVPVFGAPALQICCGNAHTLAVLQDRTIVAWGANDHGQCDVPADFGEVQHLYAGAQWSMAVSAIGEVRVWGEIPAQTLPAQTRIDTHRSPGYRSESR